ncbi:MAG TPA: hypothetical protein VNW92_08690 [Polyangiaceae bacterium]|nr:hypothetical protein [Polyangiaceae bacterium]
MTKLRSLGVAAVFLAGCAVGGASSRFVVPPASAQQVTTLTKWEYTCVDSRYLAETVRKINAAGQEGWEMVGGITPGGIGSTWCFKRPKM